MGKDLAIPCAVSSSGKDDLSAMADRSYTWHHDDIASVATTTAIGGLVMRHAQPHDAGSYVCGFSGYDRNSHQKVKQRFTHNVIGKYDLCIV